jgi:hypothetical protein
MCGLVGIIGESDNKATLDMFKYMLFFDTLRGWDSTGVFTVNKVTDGVSIIKKAMPAPDFIQMPSVRKILTAPTAYAGERYSAMIGHNRAATVGDVNSVNAHPFDHGDITLVHNGTLRNERILDSYAVHDVDSEMLCDDFNRNGWKDTIEKTVGAYALIWNDASDNTINILRNAERPLHIAICYRKGSQPNTMIGKPFVAVASESWMLTAAAERAGITIEGKPELIPTCKKLTFDLDDMCRKDLDVGNILNNVTSEGFEEALYTSGKSETTATTLGRGKTSGTSQTSGVVTSFRFTPESAEQSHKSGEYICYGKMPSGTEVRCYVDKKLASEITDKKILTITAERIGSIRNKGEDKEIMLLDASVKYTTVYRSSATPDSKK